MTDALCDKKDLLITRCKMETLHEILLSNSQQIIVKSLHIGRTL
jgi:hypothetical protein